MNILIADDMDLNLKVAEAQLRGEHKLFLYDHPLEDAFYRSKELPKADVAMLDCNFPLNSPKFLARTYPEFVRSGQEFPAGIVLALQLAWRGIPRVLVFTDVDRHRHPLSGMMDRVAGGEALKVCDSLVSFETRWDYQDLFYLDNLPEIRERYMEEDMKGWKEWHQRRHEPSAEAKNWQKLLDLLR